MSRGHIGRPKWGVPRATRARSLLDPCPQRGMRQQGEPRALPTSRMHTPCARSLATACPGPSAVEGVVGPGARRSRHEAGVARPPVGKAPRELVILEAGGSVMHRSSPPWSGGRAGGQSGRAVGRWVPSAAAIPMAAAIPRAAATLLDMATPWAAALPRDAALPHAPIGCGAPKGCGPSEATSPCGA